MPIEDMEKFENATMLPEHYKIKLGQTVAGRSGDRPSRLNAPVITHPLKSRGQSNFPIDETVMDLVRARFGLMTNAELKNPSDRADDLPGVPVLCVSDDIFRNIFIYRGFWRKSGPNCISVKGEQRARRYYDEEAHRKHGRLQILDNSVELDCTSKCYLWDSKECSYAAIIGVQLQDRPRFPSVTRYRTKGWYQIQTLIASLKAISEVTGGILTGIPLMLRRYETDVKEGSNTRRIPLVSYDWDGTISDLRRAALVELELRMRQREMLSALGVAKPLEHKVDFAPGSLTEEGLASADENLEELEKLEDAVAAEEEKQQAIEHKEQNKEKLAEVKRLKAKLSYTDQRLKLLADKHKGNIDAVIADMKKQAGEEVQAKEPDEVHTAPNGNGSPAPARGDGWGPGEEGGAVEEAEDTEEPPPPDDDDFATEGWMPGI